MAKNYWQQKYERKQDGWIYLGHDFRIKHEYEKYDWTWKLHEGKLVKVRTPTQLFVSDNSDEIHPHNIIQEEPKVKCPMCGRIKAVQKQEEHLFYCTYCNMQFDDRED